MSYSHTHISLEYIEKLFILARYYKKSSIRQLEDLIDEALEKIKKED